MELFEFALNMAMATVLGAAIGFERQVHQRRAGLRTNILVALGSAAFVTIGAFVPHEDSQSRVAAAVVTGVGFLGAGVIFKDGATIKGLDTAATVWCSAAVGTLAGWGQLAAAAVCTVIILLTNTLVRPLVKGVDRSRRAATEARAVYQLTLVCAERNGDEVRDLMLGEVGRWPLTLRSVHRSKSRDAGNAVHLTITADLAGAAADTHAVERVSAALAADPRVESAAWRTEEPGEAGEESGRA